MLNVSIGQERQLTGQNLHNDIIDELERFRLELPFCLFLFCDASQMVMLV